MIHIIPDGNTERNWAINKIGFDDIHANMIDYLAKATLSSLPECKRQPLRVNFICARGKSVLKINSKSIYVSVKAIQKEAGESPAMRHFARVIVRAVLSLFMTEQDKIFQKEASILQMFSIT